MSNRLLFYLLYGKPRNLWDLLHLLNSYLGIDGSNICGGGGQRAFGQAGGSAVSDGIMQTPGGIFSPVCGCNEAG